MVLADSGASVLRIDRAVAGAKAVPTSDMLTRHKASIVVDLKSAGGVALVKKLGAQADVLIDPFRPGVLEKLGLGPQELCKLNPRLVYARMTGFRRDGKYADMAGHDINYLAVSGVLSMLGRAGDKPHPPINLLADFAGGGAMLVQGILLALLDRSVSGRGQVVEANMVDGVNYLATFPRQAIKTPLGSQPRGTNILDGGCPYYDTYATSDGKHVAVGCLEPQFFAAMLRGLGVDPGTWATRRLDPANWPELRRIFTDKFGSKTRAEWEKVFDGTDACVTPILTYPELEADKQREGDQRPAITLADTPMFALKRGANQSVGPAVGQGDGVQGDGYTGFPLSPGAGGEGVLEAWLGWAKGREYDEDSGGALVLKGRLNGKL